MIPVPPHLQGWRVGSVEKWTEQGSRDCVFFLPPTHFEGVNMLAIEAVWDNFTDAEKHLITCAAIIIPPEDNPNWWVTVPIGGNWVGLWNDGEFWVTIEGACEKAPCERGL